MCSAQWPRRVSASHEPVPRPLSLKDPKLLCTVGCKLWDRGARGEHAGLGSDQGGADDAVGLHVQAVPVATDQLPILEAPLLLWQACASAPPCTRASSQAPGDGSRVEARSHTLRSVRH